MQPYWFSKQSNINIIYNISVITITITISIILANFGKYAISDCPFILSVSWGTHCSLFDRFAILHRSVKFRSLLGQMQLGNFHDLLHMLNNGCKAVCGAVVPHIHCGLPAAHQHLCPTRCPWDLEQLELLTKNAPEDSLVIRARVTCIKRNPRSWIDQHSA